VALVASCQVASAAPKDEVEVLDGAALGDPSREPVPVPGVFRMLDRSDRGIATKLPTAACGDDDISSTRATTPPGSTRRRSPRPALRWPGERRSGD
jgi:hypothetical protein